MLSNTMFALIPIGDIFLQTYAISTQIKLQIPVMTQMKDLSKDVTDITNVNPLFLCYGKKKGFKNLPFSMPQGYVKA